MQKILFCTGFSAHSLHAGDYALSLAQRQGAELVLLHVASDPGSEQERRRVRDTALQRLRELVPADANLAAPPQFMVEFGTAAEAILAVTAQQQPAVIVMGVRQPVGFARRLKWATAYAVVSDAACPVLTVRSPDSAGPQ